MQAGNTAHTIEASVNLAEVTCPSVKLFVRSPGGEPIQRVAVDGQPWNQWDAETESITLPVGRALKVLVSYGNE